ncbi:hypothetical protein DERP_007751 [Dermatophagoides pteronyssinus]|uniref:Uncharacterized protein n=1 Tax=Dermatophagoides pteronyssinus TaxID=6956 RepID=A0ABQ8JKM9_DERPT|nr:hypothetical protein DERP_007751 [Dermatophagoides pteronyssinus]
MNFVFETLPVFINFDYFSYINSKFCVDLSYHPLENSLSEKNKIVTKKSHLPHCQLLSSKIVLPIASKLFGKLYKL